MFSGSQEGGGNGSMEVGRSLRADKSILRFTGAIQQGDLVQISALLLCAYHHSVLLV
jgi:hypothetical protein